MKMVPSVLTAALLCGLVGLVRADEPCTTCTHKHTDCGPKMKKECVYEAECAPKKVPCWEIDKVDICIPKPRFPWQCCDTPPKCKVKTVCVPRLSSKECGPQTKWKCKVYEVCAEDCGKKGCATGAVIVTVPEGKGAEVLPIPPAVVPPMKK